MTYCRSMVRLRLAWLLTAVLALTGAFAVPTGSAQASVPVAASHCIRAERREVQRRPDVIAAVPARSSVPAPRATRGASRSTVRAHPLFQRPPPLSFLSC